MDGHWLVNGLKLMGRAAGHDGGDQPPFGKRRWFPVVFPIWVQSDGATGWGLRVVEAWRQRPSGACCTFGHELSGRVVDEALQLTTGCDQIGGQLLQSGNQCVQGGEAPARVTVCCLTENSCHRLWYRQSHSFDGVHGRNALLCGRIFEWSFGDAEQWWFSDHSSALSRDHHFIASCLRATLWQLNPTISQQLPKRNAQRVDLGRAGNTRSRPELFG